MIERDHETAPPQSDPTAQTEPSPAPRCRRWKIAAFVFVGSVVTIAFVWQIRAAHHLSLLEQSSNLRVVKTVAVPAFVFERLPHGLQRLAKKVVEAQIDEEPTAAEWDALDSVGPKRLTVRHLASNASALAAISRISSLETLRMNGGTVDASELERLLRLPRLTTLSFNLVAFPEGGETPLANAPTLERLRLFWSGVSGAALESMARQSKLRELSIADGDLSIEHVRAVSGFQRLKRLDLISVDALTAADLAPLEHLTSLRVLSIHSPETSSTSADVLLLMPELEVLIMRDCEFDDEGAFLLAFHPGLQRIDLAGTRITDAGLKRLQHAPALRELGLANTSVTPDAIAQVKKDRPDLRLRFTPIILPFHRTRLD